MGVMVGDLAECYAKHWRAARTAAAARRRAPTPEVWTEIDGHDPRSDRIIVALRSLSVQQRAVVHLTYWEDLTPAAVAERLGVSDGTVRRQLARGRDRLRKVLDGQQ